MPTTPPRLNLLACQTWNERFPNSDPSITTDYHELFGSHAWLFEGLMTEQHYYIALLAACQDFIAEKDLSLYPEDLAEQPNPVIVADAINRLCTAMASLYGMQGEPITPATGPYPVGMLVNYSDGSGHWYAEVAMVVDVTYVHTEAEVGGDRFHHGLPTGQIAYRLRCVNDDPNDTGNFFWCDPTNVLPEGK